jgi:hypothetical protein
VTGTQRSEDKDGTLSRGSSTKEKCEAVVEEEAKTKEDFREVEKI